MSLDLPFEFGLRSGRTCTMRSTTEADAEEICALLPRLHAETDYLQWMAGEFNWSVQREREFIRERVSDRRTLAMVAVVDGGIVGLGSISAGELKRFRHHAEVGMAVLQEFSRQGIGREMMRTMIAWAEAKSLYKLYLQVYPDNEAALALYTAFGFTEEARLRENVRRADDRLDDMVIMARRLEGRAAGPASRAP